MRALLAIASLLLACSAARAQYTIEYEGRTIRIDPDRGTVSIPGVYDNTGKKAKRPRTNQDRSQKQAPAPQQPTTADRQPSSDGPPKPSIQDTQIPAAQPSVPATAAPAAKATNTNTPAKDNAAAAPPAPIPQGAPSITPSPAPSVAAAPPAPAAPVAGPQTPTPTTATATAPLLTAAPPSESPAPRARVPGSTVATVAPPAPDPNSPVGIWLTEEKEGKVRIEPCGGNLCGYSLDSKSNANSDQVLIDMKPAKDQKWSGRIHDPNTGSDYDSTIALKGKDELRVQGCAFGGMFCGGQTWTRVN
jgi:uncharacterized protein (DUF2147 family)